MHDYTIDGHPKEKIFFVLSFIAISVAPALNRLAAGVVIKLDAATGWASGPVTAVPVFALFLFIYWVFNSKVWKVPLLRRWLLIPDLNGTWSCEGLTALRRGGPVNAPWQGEIVITQSWSKIRIRVRTTQSSSRSVSASLSREPGVGYRLIYNYRNDPAANELDLQKHDGTAEITFDDDCRAGTGNYFTDRHRNTVGTMALRKRDGNEA